MEKNNPKWYFNKWSLIISFLCIGPFMLPLVWVNPGLSRKQKIITTVIVIILTYLLGALFFNSLKQIKNYYQVLSTME